MYGTFNRVYRVMSWPTHWVVLFISNQILAEILSMNKIYKFSPLCIATAVAVIFKVKAGGNGFVATKTNVLDIYFLKIWGVSCA